MILWVLLAGCVPVKLGDCLLFGEGCEWFEPSGLNCGLAHEYDDHRGSSCADHDPALRYRESFVEIGYAEDGEARSAEARCPEGYTAASLLDPDAKRDDDALEESWWTCTADGNADRSSGLLRDVPAGSVCGLSRPMSSEVGYCEEVTPAEGACPEGYDFHWVVERSTRDEHPDCSPRNPSEALNNTARLLVFCAVSDDSGCIGSDCPPLDELRVAPCGLHVRYGLYVDDPLDIPLWDLGSDVLNNIYDPTASVLDYLDGCAEAGQSHLSAPLMEAVHAYADDNLSPTCQGEDISGGRCPDGYSYQCTSDVTGTPDSGDLVLRAHLCWCDRDTSCQGEPDWCSTRGW